MVEQASDTGSVKSVHRNGAARSAALLLAAWFIAISFTNVLDRLGEEATGDLLVKSIVVYAVTQAAVATLSIVQEIEFNASFVVGTTAKPFQVLSPVTDFLQTFSRILLFAITSLAFVLALTVAFGSTGVSVIYAAVVVFCLLFYFIRPPETERLRKYRPWRIFLVATVLRFAFVLIVGMNFAVQAVMLSDQEERAVQEFEARALAVQEISSQLAEASQAEPVVTDDRRGAQEESRFMRQIKESTTAMLDALLDRVKSLVRAAVDVAVVYLLQGVVIPIIFVLVIVGAVRRLLA